MLDEKLLDEKLLDENSLGRKLLSKKLLGEKSMDKISLDKKSLDKKLGFLIPAQEDENEERKVPKHLRIRTFRLLLFCLKNFHADKSQLR